jgi:hypothetical protein
MHEGWWYVRVFVSVFLVNPRIICRSAPKTNSSTQCAMDSSHVVHSCQRGNFFALCIKTCCQLTYDSSF